MGTREVYEEKLRSGNLYHEPTIKPGLGSPRCPRCLSIIHPSSVYTPFPSIFSSPFFPDSIHRTPVCHKLFKSKEFFRHFLSLTLQFGTLASYLSGSSVAGSGAGGMLSAIHGFNTGIPYVQKHVKGPKWLQLLIGLPPLLLFSAGSAAFGGYAVPKFAQLSVTSYYAASSASHYAISHVTRLIEGPHSRGPHE